MTTHVQDEPTSLLTEGMATSSGPGQEEAALAEPEDAGQKPAGKKGRKAPVDGKSPKSGIRLPCPLRVGDPERYAKITKGCMAVTYKDLSKLNEHIRRYHSWDTRCTACWKAFPGSSRESVADDKARHVCIPRELTEGEKERTIPLMSEELTEQWRKWKELLEQEPRSNKGKRASATMKHLEVVFGILNPGKKVPDLLSISSSWPPATRPSSRRPTSELSSGKQRPQEEQPPKQPTRKRQASSSPAGRRTDPKVNPFSAKQQTTDDRAEEAGFNRPEFLQYGCIDPRLICSVETSTIPSSTLDSASVVSSRPAHLNSSTGPAPHSTIPTTTCPSLMDPLEISGSADPDPLLPMLQPSSPTADERRLACEKMPGTGADGAVIQYPGRDYRYTFDATDWDSLSE